MDKSAKRPTKATEDVSGLFNASAVEAGKVATAGQTWGKNASLVGKTSTPMNRTSCNSREYRITRLSTRSICAKSARASGTTAGVLISAPENFLQIFRLDPFFV